MQYENYLRKYFVFFLSKTRFGFSKGTSGKWGGGGGRLIFGSIQYNKKKQQTNKHTLYYTRFFTLTYDTNYKTLA